MDIKGASVIVTGAASGLGNATARSFAEKGAIVFGLDLQSSIDKAVEQGIDEGITLLAADVTSEDDVKAAIAKATEAAPLRVAVNCAGIAPAARIVSKKGVHALDLFQTCISVNLVGTFNVLRLAAEAMSTQDTVDEDGQRGVIINTASVAAYEGQVGQIAYAASKGGVYSMGICAARDLAQFGIRVNTIAPGTIETPMLKGLTEEFQKSLEAAIPFPSRLGRPSDYAALA
ncbi:MAG: SDR family NAD(P)-dependent oxidoreductase, partial [Actinomycetales bacterium]|nr:SDR family NAD(P)-dependent oxidoreductase [Actinomycetales bacterium]